jgi:TRAP-type mannitol/chloroaromatic compound transport system permease small subunit
MTWIKLLSLILGLNALAFFWIVINAMTRPVYNKMHNIYQEDEKGRIIANWTIGAMIIVAFLLGYIFG